MQERQRAQNRERAAGAGGDPFPSQESQDGAGGLVTVMHAPYAEQLPVGEMTARAVRDRFQDRLDIHPQATPYLDGEAVDLDTVVHEGQRLMFMRPSGEKGRRHRRPTGGVACRR